MSMHTIVICTYTFILAYVSTGKLYTISVQHIGVLQDQLFDERWFNFLRDHLAMHQIRTAELLEEDPPVVKVTSI